MLLGLRKSTGETYEVTVTEYDGENVEYNVKHAQKLYSTSVVLFGDRLRKIRPIEFVVQVNGVGELTHLTGWLADTTSIEIEGNTRALSWAGLWGPIRPVAGFYRVGVRVIPSGPNWTSPNGEAVLM